VDIPPDAGCASYRTAFAHTIGGDEMADTWLQSLQTSNAQEGFELAIKLSRMGVKYTQPSDEVRARLRPEYDQNADSLIASSQVIAVHFQTIAAANGYWKH
jgi:hypothetical protein